MPTILPRINLDKLPYRFLVGTISLTGLLAAMSVSGHAQVDYTWTGDFSNEWAYNKLSNTNWAGNLLPPKNSSATRLVFGASRAKTITNDIGDPVTLNRITFTDFDYTLSGGDLEFMALGGADGEAQIVQTVARLNTINSSISFSNLTLDVASGGTLQINNAFSRTGAFTKSGAGTLLLSGDRNFNGAVSVLGGTLTNANAFLGSATGTTGQMRVSGAGSRWTGNGLYVGHLGAGSLTIQNGGVANNTAGWIGFDTASSSANAVTVTGAGSQWNLANDLVIGNRGNSRGKLTIDQGGQVSSSNSYIGNANSSVGSVIVSGAGSTWTTTSSLYSGHSDSASGTLTIDQGGQVSSQVGYFGFQNSSVGTALVSGAGSKLSLVNSLYVGHSDTSVGSLTINQGGEVGSRNGMIGYEEAATGTVTVSGAGSKWTLSLDAASSPGLFIGYFGNSTGTLNILDGGLVSSYRGSVGYAPGATGTVLVDGGSGSVKSRWDTSGSLTLGTNGTGMMTIQNGGIVSNNGANIAENAGSIGIVTVTGAGSQWMPTRYAVGRRGEGILNIRAGGTVSGEFGDIGQLAGSKGTVNVEGVGSTWLNNDSVYIGGYGNGTLNVVQGGFAQSDGVYLGFEVGATGTINVNGSGSQLINTGFLFLGFFGGTGSITVRDGGNLDNLQYGIGFITNGSSMTVGHGTVRAGHIYSSPNLSNITPTIQLSDPSADVSALTIGYNNVSSSAGFAGTISDAAGGPGGITKVGTGNQTLSGDNTFTGPTRINGGSIVLGNPLALQNSPVTISVNNGLNLNGQASATVGGLNGTGSLNLGTTTLTLKNTQNASYAGVLSGGNNNTQGAFFKTGIGTQTFTGGTAAAPSSFRNYFQVNTNQGATIFDGAYVNLTSTDQGFATSSLVSDNGAIVLKNGATVNAIGDTILNGFQQATTAMNVDGVGTTLNTGRFLGGYTDGRFGTLTVQNGGTVNVGNSFQLGFFGGATGSAVVTGAGSALTTGGQLIIGRNGSGNLTVANGSAVTVNGNSTFLGAFPGSTGTLTITGAGSSFTSGNAIQNGGQGEINGGTGVLNVNGGATAVFGGLLSYANSTINVGGTGALAGGTLSPLYVRSVGGSAVGNINLVDGAAALVIGNVNSDAVFVTTFSGALAGNGSVTKVGLTSQTLAGANTYTGNTTVLGGTLNLGEKTVADGNSYMAKGGTLGFAAEATLRNVDLAARDGGTISFGGNTIRNATFGGNAAGAFIVPAGSTTSIRSSTLYTGANLTNSGTLNLTSVTSGGAITQTVGAGPLTWTNGQQTAAGSLDVSGIANLSGLELGGVTTVHETGRINNTSTKLTLGAGSRTSIGSQTTSGGVVDLGGQTLELNGALLVNNGTIQNGRVNINYGSLAKGAGNYVGGYAVNDGGRIIFGNSPGLLTSGTALWGAGGGFTFQINDANGIAGTHWGLNQINGLLTIGAGSTDASRFTVSLQSLLLGDETPGLLSGFDSSLFYSWQFASASAGIVGFNPSLFALDTSEFRSHTGGGSFSLAQSGNGLFVNFAPRAVSVAPEPSALALLGVAGFLSLALRRRRH